MWGTGKPPNSKVHIFSLCSNKVHSSFTRVPRRYRPAGGLLRCVQAIDAVCALCIDVFSDRRFFMIREFYFEESSRAEVSRHESKRLAVDGRRIRDTKL